MAYNIDIFKKSVLAQANKNMAGFKPNPNDFNSFIQDALRETYNYLFGNTDTYQPGRPVAIVSVEKTRWVSEAERFLLERQEFATPTNLVPIPDGETVLNTNSEIAPKFRHLKKILVIYVPSGSSTAIKREIRILPSRDVERALDSEINYPTLKNPIGEIRSSGYQIYPAIDYAEMVYMRQPLTPKWGFSVDNTLPARERRPVYDPANSVDLDIPDELVNLVKERVLYLMGVRERDPFLVQTSERREGSGKI